MVKIFLDILLMETESLISPFFYCLAFGSLMTLVSALYWHMHVLFLLILERY